MKEFKCRHCGLALGATDGDKLLLSEKGELKHIPGEPNYVKFDCPNKSFEHYVVWQRKKF